MEYFSADSPCLKHKSPFCKRFPRQRDPFNLEKLPFEDVLNRQKHFYPTSLSPLNYSLWGVFAKMQNPDGKKLNEGNHAEILRIKNREILAAPEMVISGTGQMCTGVKSLCFLYLELIHIFCGQIENKFPLENHHHSPEKSLVYNIVHFGHCSRIMITNV